MRGTRATSQAIVLTEAVAEPRSELLLLTKRAALVALGVAVLAFAAKVQVQMWPSPVPITLGTFAVLSIGAAYGPRLGLMTIIAYMAIGALGYDVFASSSAEHNGLAYMLGGTGGYLLGYVLAVAALGWFARRGWDRNVLWMGVAMLIGTALIYAPGVAWLHHLVETGLFNADKFATPWSQTLAWGLTPYLIGDALKLALAALVFPLAWRLVGDARA
ncbi:MAG: biotin transporter BioY [Pseudomonadota bacterium]